MAHINWHACQLCKVVDWGWSHYCCPLILVHAPWYVSTHHPHPCLSPPTLFITTHPSLCTTHPHLSTHTLVHAVPTYVWYVSTIVCACTHSCTPPGMCPPTVPALICHHLPLFITTHLWLLSPTLVHCHPPWFITAHPLSYTQALVCAVPVWHVSAFFCAAATLSIAYAGLCSCWHLAACTHTGSYWPPSLYTLGLVCTIFCLCTCCKNIISTLIMCFVLTFLWVTLVLWINNAWKITKQSAL